LPTSPSIIERYPLMISSLYKRKMLYTLFLILTQWTHLPIYRQEERDKNHNGFGSQQLQNPTAGRSPGRPPQAPLSIKSQRAGRSTMRSIDWHPQSLLNPREWAGTDIAQRAHICTSVDGTVDHSDYLLLLVLCNINLSLSPKRDEKTLPSRFWSPLYNSLHRWTFLKSEQNTNESTAASRSIHDLRHKIVIWSLSSRPSHHDRLIRQAASLWLPTYPLSRTSSLV